ncbi:MAG TPA: hypothetical protein PKC91_09715 [Ignavibacteria bacterium]|nr:hypothetical protein [Ignavibacteria bacterium]
MKNTQLKELLMSLDKSEFKEFGKYIRSPYFNNRSEVIRFYEAIKKYHPKFDSPGLNENNIFKSVYPGKNYSDVLMRKLYSLSVNLLLDFISVNGFRESKLEYNIKLLDKLRERKLPALFEKRSGYMEKLLAGSRHDISYYENKLKHTSVLHGFFLNANEKSMVSSLQNELDDLVEYFIIVALVQYIRLGEWSKALDRKYDLKFQDEIIKYISKRKDGKLTLANLYYNMMMLLNTEEEKYYTELEKCRKNFERRLSEMDEYNISIVLMQYCYKRVMKGNTEYRRNQFDITKKMLDKNLIPAGYIEPYFFTNAIRNAAIINEFSWSEEFIAAYRKRLNPEFEEEITEYSFAMIEFSKGNFEKSLQHLAKINIERANMKIAVKNLMIVIYYELNYKEELISLIDTYKHFLKRDNTVTKQSIQISSQFIKFVSDLVRIYYNGNYESAYLLKKKIESTPYFDLKSWLIKKADELIN